MRTIHRDHWIIIGLLILFLAPGVAAYFFYTHPHTLSFGTTHRGQMLKPPVIVEGLSLPPKWQLILWVPHDHLHYRSMLERLARIRLALGHLLYQVDLRVLYGSKKPPSALPQILTSWGVLYSVLPEIRAKSPPRLGSDLGIFIVDPRHYWILYYPPTMNPDDLFYDLRQLLKVNGS